MHPLSHLPVLVQQQADLGYPVAVSAYRRLHAQPEIGLQEYDTSQYIR